MPVVSAYNKKEIKKLLKECPPLIQRYVKSLEDSNENYQRILGKSMSKIKELIQYKEKSQDSGYTPPACPDCGGTGLGEGWNGTCWICKGTGKILP